MPTDNAPTTDTTDNAPTPAQPPLPVEDEQLPVGEVSPVHAERAARDRSGKLRALFPWLSE